MFFGYDRIFRWTTEVDSWNLKELINLYCYGTNGDDAVVEDAFGENLNHSDNNLTLAACF